MSKTCRACQRRIEVFHDGESRRGVSFSAVIRSVADRKRWDGNRCPSCTRTAEMIYKRANGTKPIDLVDSANFRISRRSEKQVADHFLGLGFTVELTSIRGPDLIVEGFGRKFSVEVKTATRMVNGNYWKVGSVERLRRSDDYVAIVFPDGRIFIETMESHMANCDRSGSRSVTRLVRKVRIFRCKSKSA